MRMRLKVEKIERAGADHLRVGTTGVYEGTNSDRVDVVDGVDFTVISGTPEATRLFRALQTGETMFWEYVDPTLPQELNDRDELWARWAAIVKALGYSSAHGTTLDDEHGVLATIARLQAMAAQASAQTP